MGSISTAKTWLITGASQGLGLAMTLEALNAGHRVIAGARDPVKAAKASPEVEKLGGKWLKLDVNSTETTKIVKDASEEVGGFDVVVNNAGYFLAGTIEESEESEMQAAFSTNFWGPIRVLKGALPSMRARKSGTVIYNGSIFGFSPCPGGAMYSCPKSASDALQATLALEFAPFNIRFITLAAGLFRTAVLSNSKLPENGLSDALLGSGGAYPVVMGTVGKMAQDPETHIPGDPVKFARRVVEIVDGTGFGLSVEKNTRVILGNDALKLASIQMQNLAKDIETSREIAGSTDFEGTTSTGVAFLTEFLER